MADRKRALFLFSDTGGGHRSAAQAVSGAIDNHLSKHFSVAMVDMFKEYAPPPFDLIPDSYPAMARLQRAWRLGYKILDGHRRTRVLQAAVWPYMRSQVERLVADHPADIVVAFHPLVSPPILNALGRPRPPVITIVTDLISTHAFWYDKRVDMTLVPTMEASKKALDCGLRREKIRVVGLPVDESFRDRPRDADAVREELGWPADRPTVLLVGGSEGMGPLYETALAISRVDRDISLAIVAGRNRSVREELETVSWEIPTFVYGFVDNMADMMQAARLLVTKAGPGTISEALISGLPMVLYSRVPGQEEGNVDYVVSKGVGVWAPGSQETAAAVARYVDLPEELDRAALICRSIARPDAAVNVADILMAHVEPRVRFEQVTEQLSSQPTGA